MDKSFLSVIVFFSLLVISCKKKTDTEVKLYNPSHKVECRKDHTVFGMHVAHGSGSSCGRYDNSAMEVVTELTMVALDTGILAGSK